ncbi:c-type cytochrome [Nitrospirillum viridazoti]|uniref:Alcohol dehydrogenase n=1 Tax=Nitrospirillum viridazoti CBAmc TaxID=1441467 RepID=A0A248K2A4_9PROT|nr:cytochrome c [Nitrospirillum amazonense]ASG25117.1 alcohol dehydrogenase [Nitrospirillum amazonense CBAmc]TWB28715.1 mono/diheme cytochrome c family protein [Nitrospirillum amazonense]
MRAPLQRALVTGLLSLGILVATLSLVAIGLSGIANGQPPSATSGPYPPVKDPDVAKGYYVAVQGDCVGCHTVPGGLPFAGGRPLVTPFGTIYSANITPDKDAGIGRWSADDFYRALHEGKAPDGHLYPAFPYNYYTRIGRADSDALFAYLRSLPPSPNRSPRNDLPFPFNIRALMMGWNLLFLDVGEYKPDPAKSAAWNRGAYLVEGPGHCAACHTPKNLFGAPRTSRDYHGGDIGNGWYAPDITPNKRTGIGGWSDEELFQYLKTGRNVHANAAADMGEVVAYSTSRMTDDDVRAIIAYLRDRPARADDSPEKPDPAVMKAGEAVYIDTCAACHRMDGAGSMAMFPRLPGSPNLQQPNPGTLIRVLLVGSRSLPTDARPTPTSMPAFNWKLRDEQIAAVATYVRNSWGNAAAPVDVDTVTKMRKALGADRRTLPDGFPTDMHHPNPETVSSPHTDSRQNGTDQAGTAALGQP